MTSISVALCTYNGEKYLEEQLDSLLGQTLHPIEICIGDDGSTDATAKIIKKFAERAPFKVEITYNDKTMGYGENFIQTAKRCTGEWIAFCDQDDLWQPEKLRRCTTLIEQGPKDLRLVVHNASIVNSKGEYQTDIARDIGYEWGSSTLFKKNELPAAWLMYGNCIVFHRSLIQDVPTEDRAWPWFSLRPYDEHDAHDAWVPILAAALGSVVATDEKLIIYRRHQSNTTHSLSKATLQEALWARVFPNAKFYRERSFQLNSLARRLRQRTDMISNSEYQRDLRMASQRYCYLARIYEQRLALVEGTELRTRLKALLLLVRMGAYRAPPGWGFKRGSLLKDLAYAIISSLKIFKSFQVRE